MAEASFGSTGHASSSHLASGPPSPALTRHQRLSRRGSFTADEPPDERTGLLQSQRLRPSRQPHLTRSHSYAGTAPRHHSRAGSWSQRLIHALSDRQESSMSESKASIAPDERVWYDQFTSTDWVHDSILDSYRVKALRSRKDFWGRVYVLFDSVQGWLLSALVGFVVAVLAYAIDVSEAVAFDYKDGYCTLGWYRTEKVRAHRLLRVGAKNEADPARAAAPTGRVRTGASGRKSWALSARARCGPSTAPTSAASSSLPRLPAS